MKRGLPYPIFHQGSFPSSHEEFVTIQHLDSFTEEDYEYVKQAYKYFECKSLEEYKLLSVKAEVHCLASLTISYWKFCQKTFFGIGPFWDISLSGYAFSVAHYVSKSSYRNLDDGRIFKVAEESLLPGLSTSTTRKADFLSTRLGDICEKGDNCECLAVDMKAQFASILLETLAYDKYEYWDEERVNSFDISMIDQESNIRYILKCSLSYPSRLHLMTQSLPLCYCRLNSSETSKNDFCGDLNFIGSGSRRRAALDLSCYDKKDIWISGQLLMLFLGLGMELLGSITGVISYRVEKHLAKFATLCIDARRNCKNDFYKHFCKAIPNLCVGKFMQSKDSVGAVLTTIQQQTERYLCRTQLVDAFPIQESLSLLFLKRILKLF